MLKKINSVLDTVGNTPLIRFSRMAGPEMANVWGKAEHLNPTGSIKDRIAASIIDRAEKSGALKPGGTIIEATAGNTGLSFAMVAAIRGYRCIFVLTEKFTGEKVDMLKAYGAEVVITPANLPPGSPDGWTETAERIAKEIPNSFYVNQFHNQENPEAHYETTGPEIWEQTGGEIDYFVAGAGSGGTISGVGKFLKEKAREVGREIKVICPDPIGSAYFDTFYKRKTTHKRAYRIEGIGNDMVPSTLDFSVIDEVRQVSDRDSFYAARQAARTEGIFIGGSGGSNLHVALEVAREAGPGKNVVFILCDSGNRYISKMFNDSWMRDQGFRDLNSVVGKIRDIMAYGHQQIEYVSEKESIATVAARMSALGISQMPMRLGSDLKMVHEGDLLQALVSGQQKPNDPVSTVAKPLRWRVSLDDSIDALAPIFEEGSIAVVFDQHEIKALLSKIDLVQYLASGNNKLPSY